MTGMEKIPIKLSWWKCYEILDCH